MVLIRRGGALAAVALAAACNQSLFDNHTGGGGGGGGGDDTVPDGGGSGVPTSCPETCLGDAAANFDGSPHGSTGRWRYLEDQSAFGWIAMTGGATGLAGQDVDNRVAPCRGNEDLPSCRALPGALVISASGASDVDPALEFTAPATQVIQLSLRAYLASGTDQTIRIYRNSRVDLLYAAPLTATNLVEHTLVVDAIMGDRFLVAISGALAASNVALQLYVNATGDQFPAQCQLAMPYPSLDPTKVSDPCGGSSFTYYAYNTISHAATATAVPRLPGPFSELAQAIDVTQSHFLSRDPSHVVDWTHDTTLQFWLRLRTAGAPQAIVVNDLDPDQCSGVELSVFPLGTPQLQLQACVNPATTAFDFKTTPFPASVAWHFIRLVRTTDRYELCIDAAHAFTLPALPDAMPTVNAIDIGKAGTAPSDTFLDGQIDDLRVFSAALPCP
ncbi:MAG TPA: LamG-like jellyroll fold domain-containing protein [Kofleriaceae bacterium]|nr:LamG-like jellyroll fold domain-containing protein [Kofleriaceae bacterium]